MSKASRATIVSKPDMERRDLEEWLKSECRREQNILDNILYDGREIGKLMRRSALVEQVTFTNILLRLSTTHRDKTELTKWLYAEIQREQDCLIQGRNGSTEGDVLNRISFEAARWALEMTLKRLHTKTPGPR